MALVGGVATLGAAALGDWAIQVVGGSAYLPLAPYAWMFVLLGSLFALAQLLLYDRLAQRDGTAIGVLWVAVGVETLAIIVQSQPTLVSIITPALIVAGTVVALGLMVTLRPSQARLGATHA